MSAVTDPIADMLDANPQRDSRAPSARGDALVQAEGGDGAHLKEEGYISNFKVAEEGKKKVLKVFLRYGTGRRKRDYH